ncbi:MAG: hypothetical protein CL910_19970, partial [Deltaproteobacteria bacterium]|nr:hypothetical protein [Deltaproteobacteria bacterium]
MDGEGSPAPNRFELRRQQNRAALLDAALTLFQEQGLRDTKLEEICAHADVAPRTFFNHFETREHLYAAIAERRAVQLAAAFDAAGRAELPFAERLTDLLGRAARYVASRPLYRELVAEMLNLRGDGGG